jgi:hypothetical protein
LVGAKKETRALASPIAAVTAVGAFGTVDGVAALDAKDWADVPIPLVATTLNVYGVPFVSPVMTQDSATTVDVHVPAITLPAV